MKYAYSSYCKLHLINREPGEATRWAWHGNRTPHQQRVAAMAITQTQANRRDRLETGPVLPQPPILTILYSLLP